MSEKSRAFALSCIRQAKRWQLAAVQGLQLASLPLNQRIELASQSPTSPISMGRSEAARRAFIESNKATWTAHFRASPEISGQFLGDESLYLSFLESEVLTMSVDDVLLNFSAASGQVPTPEVDEPEAVVEEPAAPVAAPVKSAAPVALTKPVPTPTRTRP